MGFYECRSRREHSRRRGPLADPMQQGVLRATHRRSPPAGGTGNHAHGGTGTAEHAAPAPRVAGRRDSRRLTRREPLARRPSRVLPRSRRPWRRGARRERGGDMAEKTSSRRAAGHDLEASSPDRIRNVVLVGPGGSGKTTLVETLLAASGAVPRAGSVRDGTTVCDFEESEHAHGRSISLAVAPLVHDGHQGQPDRHPRVRRLRGRAAGRPARRRLRAVRGRRQRGRRRRDPVAVAGVRGGGHAARGGDHQARPGAGRLRRRAAAGAGGVRRAGDAAVRAGPVGAVPRFRAARAHRGPDRAARPGRRRRPGRAARRADRGRDRGVRGRDADGPLRRRRGDRRGGADRRPRARGGPRDVLPGGAGLLRDRRRLHGAARPRRHARSRRRPSTPHPRCSSPPAPPPAPITCDPDGPLVAEVVKTTSDPYVGRLSLVRVFSGTLVPDQTVHVSGHLTAFFGEATGHEDHDEDERIGALAYAFGRTQVPATRLVAGDLGAIGRLTRAETGDTLSDVDDPRVLRPWSLPEPLLPIAIVAHSKADEDKLSQALARLGAEDPSPADRQQPRDPPARAVVHGRGARRRGARAAHAPATPSTSTRCRSRCPCARRSPGRPRATAGTSSSPAGTASTPSATSRSSRCPRGRASSSSTRSWAAPYPASSSPASRRACAPRWSAASATATRSSTSGSR